MGDDYMQYIYRKAAEDPEWWARERARQEESLRRSQEERQKWALLEQQKTRFTVYKDQPSRFLYVIADADRDEVKVGFSGNVANRLRNLQTGRPTKLYIYTSEIVDCLRPREAEDRAHALLKRHRLKGEWFNCHPEMALTAIRRAAWEAEDGWQADDA